MRNSHGGQLTITVELYLGIIFLIAFLKSFLITNGRAKRTFTKERHAKACIPLLGHIYYISVQLCMFTVC